MQYPDSLRFSINKRYSLLIACLIILLFFVYQYSLCAFLLSGIYSDLSLDFLKRAKITPKEIMVKKVLFYKDALKMVDVSINFNHRNSDLYAQYAKIIREIAEDSDIRNAVNLRGTGVLEEEFYSLAMRYYKRAASKEPTIAVYHKGLGFVYDKLFDIEQADREFDNALLLDPENIEMRIDLLRYFLSRGEEARFQRHLNSAFNLCYSSSHRSGLLAKQLENFLKRVKREDLIRK